MGSISYAISCKSARAEVAKYVREGCASNGREVVASNYAPGDEGGMKWGGYGGTYFAAIRDPDGTVWALITLFGQHKGEVFINAMSETTGPGAVGVGPRVLAALTPLPDDAHEWQRNWRTEADKYQQRRKAALAARGKTIKLPSPVKLTGGSEVDTVEVVDLKRWRAPGLRIRPNWDWFMSDWAVAA